MTANHPEDLVARLRADAVEAGNTFRDKLLDKADGHHSGARYPFWHGWAIMDAFLAGVEWMCAREAAATIRTRDETIAALRSVLAAAREWVELGPELPGVSQEDEADARATLVQIDRALASPHQEGPKSP